MTKSQDATKAVSGFTVRWHHAMLAGLIHAGLMFLAFPPISLFGISFIAAIPLLCIAWHTNRPFRHGLLVMVGMLPFYAYHSDYVFRITAAGYVPLVIYLSAWPGIFVWCAGIVRRRLPKIPAVVLLPVIWTGLDTVRGEIIWGGFEWYQIGQPLIEVPAIASVASLGGGYLLTLLIITLGALVFDLRSSASKKKSAWGMAGLALVVWSVSLFGYGSQASGDGFTLRLSLIQTNVPQDNKVGWTLDQRAADFREFSEMTVRAAAETPDLIVWPETMFPGFALDDAGALAIQRDGFGHANDIREAFLAFQAQLGVPMLVGAITAEGLRIDEDGKQTQDATYNSAYVIADGAVQPGRYDKLAPTPFGETLPYINSVPWLKKMVLRIGLGASGMDLGLEAGKNAKPLELQIANRTIHVATPICFESTKSAVCRDIARGGPGADLLIVMTNDGWFGESDHIRQMHLLLARWRCVELGLPMARVANTGQSCFVDATGRVTALLPAREPGILTSELLIEPGRASTRYSSIGNLIGWATLAGLVSLLGGSIFMRFKEKPSLDTKRDS